MFAQTHAFEHFDGIGVEDLPCALARIDSEQDGNQSAHDMSVAVAGKTQHWAARAIREGARWCRARLGSRSPGPCWHRYVPPPPMAAIRAPAQSDSDSDHPSRPGPQNCR